jgi:anthraniloyl-CoA monooxygenase
MKVGRIAVLGGGPGGLYVARLLKLAQPHATVDVYERGEPDKTFGFGVGLAPRTQKNLGAADQSTFDDIARTAYAHDMSLEVGPNSVRLASDNLLAIGRAELLQILQRHAREAGVQLHYGSRVQASDLAADLILGADGASSATRDGIAAALGLEVTVGAALYLWCGTDFALPRALFAPAITEHGTFVTHAYPYAPDRSTFLIETDEASWRRAGFDATTAATAKMGVDASDEPSLAYLSRAFETQLEGHRLIGNRTRWLRFRTIRCQRWHHRNVVLLGDAAHTAHYSIGSGTKLAMEDAIAFAQALAEASTLQQAFELYESRRRPAVEHLQSIAARSQDWWDSFPDRLHLSVDQLMVAYMTRAGKVTLSRFAVKNAPVVARALGELRGEPVPSLEGVDPDSLALEGHVLAADAAGQSGTERVECTFVGGWSRDANALLERLTASSVKLPARYWLYGPGDRERVLDRLDFAERVKLRLRGAHEITVTAEAPAAFRADLAAALVSHRVDDVSFTRDA